MKNVVCTSGDKSILTIPSEWSVFGDVFIAIATPEGARSICFELEQIAQARDAMTALIKAHPGAPRYKVQQDGDDLIVADHIDPDNPQVVLKACTPVGREPAEWFETTFAPVHVPGPWAWED